MKHKVLCGLAAVLALPAFAEGPPQGVLLAAGVGATTVLGDGNLDGLEATLRLEASYRFGPHFQLGLHAVVGPDLAPPCYENGCPVGYMVGGGLDGTFHFPLFRQADGYVGLTAGVFDVYRSLLAPQTNYAGPDVGGVAGVDWWQSKKVALGGAIRASGGVFLDNYYGDQINTTFFTIDVAFRLTYAL